MSELDKHSKYNILIVDDEPLVRKVLQDILLSENGYQVSLASDGMDGLEKWRHGSYDLMIVDLRMPRMDGEELIGKIRKKDQDMAIIVLTGHGSLSEASNLLVEFMISDFLYKPLDHPGVLLFSVQNALEKRNLKQNLQQAHRQVEKKVAQRTAELKKANVQLLEEIQKHKKTEAERLLLAKTINQAAEGVIILGSDGKVIYVNPACEKVFERPKKEIEGQDFNLLVPEKSFSEQYHKMWEVISGGQVWNGHLSMEKKDKNNFEGDLTISPVFSQSKEISNYIGILYDVTEKLLLEKQLRQSQKLEAMGTMAGGIAHDFNNIIGTMLGYTWLLSEKAESGSSEMEFLTCIEQAGEHASQLVQQILTFSRVEETELQPISLGSLVKETIKLMKVTISANIDICPSLMTDSSLVLANATQINQVLINLYANANDAMKGQGGRLDIILETVPVSSIKHLKPQLEHDTYLRLAVKDTGCGMSADIKERIFEPFFTTKSIGKGTGIGLAVVHSIVENHQGIIKVESTPGKGSIFEIFLPRIEGETVSASKEETRAEKGKEHIMVVEDQIALAKLYEISLKKSGYKVTVLNNGRDALNLFKDNMDRFDLIFTDQAMPEMTGLQLSQAILKIKPAMPIILSTGFDATLTETKVKSFGINHFLMKPVKIRQLTLLIRQIFD